jgi:hypothetical protein
MSPCGKAQPKLPVKDEKLLRKETRMSDEQIFYLSIAAGAFASIVTWYVLR